MSKRPRDNQRGKVYKAENTVFDPGEKMTLEEVEQFVHEVWNFKPLRMKKNGFVTPYNKPRVSDGRRRRSGASFGGRIALPKFARNKWYILHELAHEITFRDLAGHGPEFCGNYLWLVESILGFESREKLGAAFRAHRVKIKH